MCLTHWKLKLTKFQQKGVIQKTRKIALKLATWVFCHHLWVFCFVIHSFTRKTSKTCIRVGQNSNFTKIIFFGIDSTKIEFQGTFYKRIDTLTYDLMGCFTNFVNMNTKWIFGFLSFSPLINWMSVLNRQIKLFYFLCKKTKKWQKRWLRNRKSKHTQS